MFCKNKKPACNGKGYIKGKSIIVPLWIQKLQFDCNLPALTVV
jgi:hypothetical protein